MSQSPDPLTAEQIAPLLGLKNGAAVRRLARRRVLPCIQLGYRTKRFSLPACQAALERRTIKAI